MEDNYSNKGTLEERYALYVECMKSLGEEPITFDEWLNK